MHVWGKSVRPLPSLRSHLSLLPMGVFLRDYGNEQLKCKAVGSGLGRPTFSKSFWNLNFEPWIILTVLFLLCIHFSLTGLAEQVWQTQWRRPVKEAKTLLVDISLVELICHLMLTELHFNHKFTMCSHLLLATLFSLLFYWTTCQKFPHNRQSAYKLQITIYASCTVQIQTN